MERVFLVQDLVKHHDGSAGDGHGNSRAKNTEQSFHTRTSL